MGLPCVPKVRVAGRACWGSGPRLGGVGMAFLGAPQSGRYTVGGAETFDSLTDLVEHFKKTGIEEASGAFVYLRQVRKWAWPLPAFP